MGPASVAELQHDEALRSARRENETLYAVIKTVSSSLDLDRVLRGIVDIATDATGCHACFIYFLEGERLVLRAASPQYRQLLGKVELGLDEGLAGWVARNKTPEFIPEDAMSDERMKYVPELEEERFQSMVAVPVLNKGGEVMGVAVLHTAAPREFDDEVLNFLVHTASLVAGAIENAQLYEETRRRVQALTTLTELSQAMAAVTALEDLYSAVTRGARELLGADACQIYRLDAEADELFLAGSDPSNAPRPAPRPGGAASVLELMRRANGRGRGGRRRLAKTMWPDLDDSELLVAPLVAGDEQLGILCCISRERDFGDEDAELLGAVAHQTSVGSEEGGADRATDGREHRQGHVRRARRGLGRVGRGEGRARPDATWASPTCSSTSSGRPRPREARRSASWRPPWRGSCAGWGRGLCSTRARTACGC